MGDHDEMTFGANPLLLSELNSGIDHELDTGQAGAMRFACAMTSSPVAVMELGQQAADLLRFSAPSPSMERKEMSEDPQQMAAIFGQTLLS